MYLQKQRVNLPLIFVGICLEFRGNYLLKAFASKFNGQILDMKITKFLPLESRGILYNSVVNLVKYRSTSF